MKNSFFVIMLKTPEGGQRLLPRSGIDSMGAILYESEDDANKMKTFWQKHTSTGEIATVEHIQIKKYKEVDDATD